MFIIAILFSSVSIYSVPKVSNETISIDTGDFDVNFVSEKFLIYSDRVANVTENYDRKIYYIYDFESSEKRSFGRYSKQSRIYESDNDEEFYIFEVSKYGGNVTYGFENYDLTVYKFGWNSKNRNIIKSFKFINLSDYYYQITKDVNGDYLLEVLEDEFYDIDNVTDEITFLHEVIGYYSFKNDNFEKISKQKYHTIKAPLSYYENSKFKVTSDELVDKSKDEIFKLNLPDNKICGVSDKYIYYLNKLFYEGAKKPLNILVKYDYRNKVKQEIIIKSNCITGDLSFYANPYIFDLNTDNFNYLLIDNEKIEILNEKILFLNEDLSFSYLDLEAMNTGEVPTITTLETQVVEDNKSELNLTLETNSNLSSAFKSKLSNNIENSFEKISNFNNENTYIEEDRSLSEIFFTKRNIFFTIILLEFFVTLFVIINFLLPKKEKNNFEIVREVKEKREFKLPKISFSLPRVSLPNIRFRDLIYYVPKFKFSFKLPKLPKLNFNRKNKLKLTSELRNENYNMKTLEREEFKLEKINKDSIKNYKKRALGEL